MINPDSFDEIFAQLRPILERFANTLVIVTDSPTSYSLDANEIMANKQRLFFGSVQIKKNYVSFHLMPLYVFPELIETLTPELKKKMQGKSCFNFKRSDSALFEQLVTLVEKGYERYVQVGWIRPNPAV